MNIELKPIAESKVRQLGGDVCGVLVRKEDGALAAVSEHGRVTWLDDDQPSSEDRKSLVRRLDIAINGVEGAAQQASLCDIVAQVEQAARAKGVQEVEPVGFVQGGGLEQLSRGHPAKIYPKNVTPSPLESHTFVYTYPPTSANQGGVLEGRVAIPRDVAEAKGMYLVGYSWLKYNAPHELTSPSKPEQEWVYREPDHGEEDYCGQVWTLDRCGHVELLSADDCVAEFMSGEETEIIAFQPTGLKRPQPPAGQEGSGDA